MRSCRHPIPGQPPANSSASADTGLAMINHARSRTRPRGEHPYQVLKHLCGFRKARYRGLEKNRVRLYGALALVNLYRMRRSLLKPGQCLR